MLSFVAAELSMTSSLSLDDRRLRRPYGTLGALSDASFPTLKRGANDLSAYSAKPTLQAEVREPRSLAYAAQFFMAFVTFEF